MSINLYGCIAFAAALGLGALVRLFIPDEVMTAPKAPLSTGASLVVGLYVIIFVGWCWIYFRTPRNAALALFGSLWSGLGAAALSVEVIAGAQWAALPAVVICVSFSLLTMAQWFWLKSAKRSAIE